MERRKILLPAQLLLTNPVSVDSIQFGNVCAYLAAGSNPPSIVSAQWRGRQHLILDGNHRALAYAYLGLPIRAFEVRNEKDIDSLLLVEAKGCLGEFPHRSFLTGRVSFALLKKRAEESARSLGMLTVEVALGQLRRKA